MSGFDHQNQLKRFKEHHRPVEVRFYDTPEVFTVAYILDSNQDYVTLLEITPEATFDGICIYPTNRINSIKVDTPYLSTLDIDAQASHLLKQAELFESSIKEYTFDGFLAANKKTSTLIELTTFDNETIAGHVLNFNNDVVEIMEYAAEFNKPVAHAYIYRVHLIRLAIEVPWLRAIKNSLK